MSSGSVLLNIGKFFFIYLLFFYPHNAYAAWTQQIVDSSIDARYMSLDIDNSGFVHLSYYDDTNDNLKYAYFNGANWVLQTVDSEYNVGIDSSLRLTSDGYARISYARAGTAGVRALRYAEYNGTGWTTSSIVGGSGGAYGNNSLELTSEGYGRVSFQDQTTGGLQYASYNGTTWTVSMVDSSISAGAMSAIALNTQGYARIAYNEYDGDDLKYASFNGTGWEIQTVADTGHVGDNPSLALNAQGYARISYQDNNDYFLKYAQYNGTGWEVYRVDSTIVSGASNSLALDASGYAYISYIENLDALGVHNLKLAHFNGTGWDIETLYTNISNLSGQTEMSLGMYNNYVYITFAQGNRDLVVVTNAPAGFVPEPPLDMLGKVLFFSLLFLFFWGYKRKAKA